MHYTKPLRATMRSRFAVLPHSAWAPRPKEPPGATSTAALVATLLACAGLLTACSANATTEDAPEGAAVTGAVTAAEQSALPPGSVATIRLQDVSLMDAPAEVLSEEVVDDPGSFPIPFVLPFEPDAIDERNTYTVAARIEDGDGGLLFINTTSYQVITHDHPTSKVEVIVEQVNPP